jgi:hypothetical protein
VPVQHGNGPSPGPGAASQRRGWWRWGPPQAQEAQEEEAALLVATAAWHGLLPEQVLGQGIRAGADRHHLRRLPAPNRRVELVELGRPVRDRPRDDELPELRSLGGDCLLQHTGVGPNDGDARHPALLPYVKHNSFTRLHSVAPTATGTFGDNSVLADFFQPFPCKLLKH